MENDTFGGAILAWVKSPRRAGHGMPGQRHGPVQGKLHSRRGAGIELPASLRHRLRQGRLHRHPERKREALKSKDLVGEASPCLQPLCPRVPQTVIPAKAGISFPIRVQTVFRTPPLLRAPPLKPRNRVQNYFSKAFTTSTSAGNQFTE